MGGKVAGRGGGRLQWCHEEVVEHGRNLQEELCVVGHQVLDAAGGRVTRAHAR